eukprot:9669068-Alexandrium_andersonii.AAC.2
MTEPGDATGITIKTHTPGSMAGIIPGRIRAHTTTRNFTSMRRATDRNLVNLVDGRGGHEHPQVTGKPGVNAIRPARHWHDRPATQYE